jgi:hypothetical protein
MATAPTVISGSSGHLARSMAFRPDRPRFERQLRAATHVGMIAATPSVMTTIDKDSLIVISGGRSCGPAAQGKLVAAQNYKDQSDGEYDRARIGPNCVVQVRNSEMKNWLQYPEGIK